jgi:hypothetical protein
MARSDIPLYSVEEDGVRKSSKTWLFGGLGLAACITFFGVVELHKKDFCISQMRFATDKEMYAAALKRNYAPYRIEHLQEIILSDATGKPFYRKSGTVLGLNNSEKLNGISTLPKRVDRLIKNPAFVKACCERTKPFEGDDFGSPTVWQVFNGMSPRSVNIQKPNVWVAPRSISPALYQETSDGDWLTDVDKLDIIGPIIKTQKYSTRVEVTVCGETYASQNNDGGLW